MMCRSWGESSLQSSRTRLVSAAVRPSGEGLVRTEWPPARPARVEGALAFEGEQLACHAALGPRPGEASRRIDEHELLGPGEGEEAAEMGEVAAGEREHEYGPLTPKDCGAPRAAWRLRARPGRRRFGPGR